jgi:hypothetical protein
MTKTSKPSDSRGSLARAVFVGVLAAVGASLGISIDDLTTQHAHKSASSPSEISADASTHPKHRWV